MTDETVEDVFEALLQCHGCLRERWTAARAVMDRAADVASLLPDERWWER